jgi:hypothetical protein
MNHDTANPAVLDDQCINIQDPLELHIWAKSLGATREEIRSAVAEVGPFIDNVIEHLSRT